MTGAYSTDLRSRVLAAVEAGESPEAVAERFAVGRSTVYRWVAAVRDEGRREAKRV
jgi:transposase